MTTKSTYKKSNLNKKPKNKHRKRTSILYQCLIILLIIPFIVFSCRRRKEVIVDKEIPVEIYVASDKAFFNEFTYFGKIDAEASIKASFLTGGSLNSVKVKAGDQVSKGQVIATVDNTNAQNTYNAAKSAYNRALDGYNRAKKVYDNGSMSELDWMEIKTTLEQAESMAKIAEKKLNDCVLRSPTNGTVLKRYVEAGTNVLPSQPIVEIANTKKLVVSFSIPEKEISKVHVGQKAKVTINALDSLTLYGSIIEKNIIADDLSQSYQAKIAFDNKNEIEDLYLGMNCKVFLDNDISNSGLQIPFRAVQMDNNDNRYVWIAVEENNNGDDRYGDDRYGADGYGDDGYGGDRYGDDRHGDDGYGDDGYGGDGDYDNDDGDYDRTRNSKNNVNYIAKKAYIKIGDLTDNGVIVTDGITQNSKVITSGYLKLHDGVNISITNYK